jgi:hypothetical protein
LSVDCAFADTASDKTAVLFGDSHAAMWFTPLEPLLQRAGWRLYSLTFTACPPFVRARGSATSAETTECDAWRKRVLEEVIPAQRPKLVLMSSSVGYPLSSVAGRWGELVASAVQSVRRAAPAARIVWISDMPRLLGPTMTCVNTTAGLGWPIKCLPGVRDSCSVPVADTFTVHAQVAGPETHYTSAELRALSADASGNTAWIDPAPWICPPDRGASSSQAGPGRCYVCTSSGMPVFRDSNHMHNTFAATLEPLLAAALLPHLHLAEEMA